MHIESLGIGAEASITHDVNSGKLINTSLTRCSMCIQLGN